MNTSRSWMPEILPFGFLHTPPPEVSVCIRQMFSAANFPSHESMNLLPFPRTRSVCNIVTWALATSWEPWLSLCLPQPLPKRVRPQSRMPSPCGNKQPFFSKGEKPFQCGRRRAEASQCVGQGGEVARTRCKPRHCLGWQMRWSKTASPRSE